MARLEIALLGPFRVTIDNKPATRFETATARLLLSYLVLHAGTPIPRETLADLFWPDQPRPQAFHALRQTLCRVRHALGEREDTPRYLLVTPQSIQFNHHSDYWLDVTAFKDYVTRIHHHPHRRLTACSSCVRWLTQAAEIYCGELLTGFHLESLPFQEWLVVKRESLHRQAMDVFYYLSTYYYQQQQYELAEHYARRQLEAEPWREEAHRQLMAALAASGQRSAALAQYTVCKQVLHKELGAEPETATRLLYEQIQSETFVHTPRHNLPAPLTRFIGRAAELAQLADYLNTPGCRLLTLTGPGGVGKTRIALEVGHQMLPYYPDGVWLVSLGSITDPVQVVPTVASVLGVREDGECLLLTRLAEYLRGKCLLLILDNCEHVAEPISILTETLLQAAPELQILITSRKMLGAAGEVNVQVSPLSAPKMADYTMLGDRQVIESPPDSDLVQRLLNFESVMFFAERAAAASSTFAITRENALAIGQICQLLDGLPLALELAAAQMNSLTPQQILEYLKNSSWLLSQRCPTVLPRQRTLRATLDWSYALLSSKEQVLFRRLSVFAGSFSPQAVESICSDENFPRPQVLEALAGLMNASLVRAERMGEVRRLRLHEVTRQFTQMLLAESGEEWQIRNQHLEYFCHLAESLEGNLFGEIPPSAFDQLNQDYDNLRSALEWSLQEQGNAQLGLRLAAALPNFWEARGQFAVEKGWLETLMQRASKTASQALRAKALRAAGRLAYYQCDFPAARTFFEQSIKLDQELGNHLRLADTLGRLGFLLSVQQDYEVAESFYQESLTLFQKLNDHSGVARILSELGYIAFRRGDHELASTLLEKSLALFREPDDRYLASRSRMILGHIARLEGNYTKARSLYNKALTTVKELDNTWGIFYLLEAFAHLAIAEGQIERATRLFGATEELGKSIGTVLTPAEKTDHERSIANAHASLDAVAFEQALAAGRSMTVEEAISYALTVSTD